MLHFFSGVRFSSEGNVIQPWNERGKQHPQLHNNLDFFEALMNIEVH